MSRPVMHTDGTVSYDEEERARMVPRDEVDGWSVSDQERFESHMSRHGWSSQVVCEKGCDGHTEYIYPETLDER